MITKDAFLKKYNITEGLFNSAGITWDELCDIYDDFDKKKDNKYQGILDTFTEEYLKDLYKMEEIIRVHSILSRVKDPEHLLAKIVRKKQENYRKYRKLDKTNYEKFLTDLIGIRCLVLFKSDWKSFHSYIMSKFENDANLYIKDSLEDFDENEEHYYLAEKPKVHIRNGDSREIYDGLLSPDCVIDGKVYRSVHYIIKYKGVYLEIQVRTLFEEGWGEVDHTIVYPYFQKDPILKEYTELLNRLSGLADEMSDFFYRVKELEKEHLESGKEASNGITAAEQSECVKGSTKKVQDKVLSTEDRVLKTPNECLRSVLDE